jgi:C1A family cysteine protease
VPEPATVDLRPELGPIRDQGQRPTCLVFAASSSHEHARGQAIPLSAEALFQGSKKRDGLPSKLGTTVSAAMATAEEDGQCDEVAWPYGDAVASDPDAPYFRARADSNEQHDLVASCRTSLAAGRPVLLVLRIADSWFSVGKTGRIPSPGPADQLEGMHAVAAVGYDDSQQSLIIRNSWGLGWGEAGYAWLPYDYLELHGVQALTLVSLH